MARFKPEVARRATPLIVMTYDGWCSIQPCPITRDYVFMSNTNEPAFPRDHQSDGHNGMSLRDYFAAKALQGMLACPIQPQSGPDMYARDAYALADAMLNKRKQNDS